MPVIPILPAPTPSGGAGFPVLDSVFLVENVVDTTKQFNTNLSGQGPGTTTTLRTTATISRPFRLPDISGTAIVQEDATGQVFMGIGVTTSLHGSNAGLQYSTTTPNRAQFRENQYGANTAGAGITTFKSRNAVIGALGAVLPGDLVGRWTSIGVPANGVSLNLSALISVQVPTAYVPVITDAFLPTEFEIALVPITATTGTRPVFKVSSDGETQTLRGSRAGGPSTLPAALGAGALRSSDAVLPNGAIVGSPGDFYTETTTGTAWIKETGIGTNTGWVSARTPQNLQFAGTIIGAGAAVPGFLSNSAFTATGPVAPSYRRGTASRFLQVSWNITINTLAVTSSLQVLRNGVVIPGWPLFLILAGSLGGPTNFGGTFTVAFAPGDTIDVSFGSNGPAIGQTAQIAVSIDLIP